MAAQNVDYLVKDFEGLWAHPVDPEGVAWDIRTGGRETAVV